MTARIGAKKILKKVKKSLHWQFLPLNIATVARLINQIRRFYDYE